MDLLVGAEEVGVVLGEAADAGHAAELAGFFPTVDGAELGEADREIAVAVVIAGVDLDVVRAVHRLEHEAVDGAFFERVGEGGAGRAVLVELHHRLAFGEGDELAFFVVGEVAGGAVEVELADVWGEDLGVALLVELGADEFLELVAHDGAFWFPED